MALESSVLPRYAAWALCIFTLAVLAASIWLGLLNGATLADLSWLPFVAACALVGGLISSRRPRLVIGWLFALSAVSFALMQLTGEYALYGLVTNPGSLPAARAAIWPQSWLPLPGIVSVAVFLPLTFPNGRALSKGWRRVIRTLVVICCFLAALEAVRPTKLLEVNHGPALPNPLGVSAFRPVVGLAGPLVLLLLIVGIALGAVCLIRRYRHSPLDERVQIKWLMLAVSALPIVTLMGKVSSVADVLTVPALIALPVSVAVAILRHNLYDIDLIIRRTLVYAVLTVLLGALYLVTVIALQGLARAITGQTSDLAVAIATLAAVALFSPLRQRIQTVIDRYFYRRKYDAARILAEFQSALRDEVDLNHLQQNMVTVVQETVQPAAVSLWLPPHE
jgi:hypothetical protein